MSRDYKATVFVSAQQQQFCVLPFVALRKEFIKCEGTRTDATLKPLQYHVDYDISGSVITFTQEALEDLANVRVYRETPSEYLLTQYVDASVLKAYDMNVRDVQMLHILEEAYDFMLWYGMLFDYETRTWDAKLGRITALSNPENMSDATNKLYVDAADDDIKQYIQDYCMLFDEDIDAWDARNKPIAKVAEPTNNTDATTKHYVDSAINALNQAIRAYIAEVRESLQEAINALTERVSTNEEAIAQLKTRMATAEANITAIQSVLNQHAAAISANTQGINANTSAIEAIQQTLVNMQDTIDSLPSGGGGGGGSIEDIEELKQEIIDSLYVSVAKPTIRNINHYEPNYDWEQESWYVELNDYNNEAMTIQGDLSTQVPGWHTIICTLKPLYKWNDGTTAPYELRWYAETNRQVISLDRVVCDGPNASCRGTLEMHDLAGNIGYQWNGDATTPANAPIKTFYFNFTQPYTKLCTEGMGQTHEEGDTFYFNAQDENHEQNPIYKFTVGHDWVKIEGNGYNSGSSESINIICDNDMSSRFVISFTASGWIIEEETPTILLNSITVDGTEHAMSDNQKESPYSLKLDNNTEAAQYWTVATNQTLNFTISEPYTELHAKLNATGVVANEGETLTATSTYQGEEVSRFRVIVGHDNVEIVGIGYNSSAQESFTVYTDDNEENGFVVTVLKTTGFPTIIGYNQTPSIGSGTPYSYTDSNANITYKYARLTKISFSDSDIAAFLANGSITKSHMILSGDFVVNEKSDSGDYTFTITPAEGYEWGDHTNTAKTYTWTHERTRDNVAAPTLTLQSEHKLFGSTPKLYYGGNDMVIKYETDSDGEIEVEVTDSPTYPREPEYEVDTVNKTITLRLTRPGRFEVPVNEYGNWNLSYSNLQNYVYSNTLLKVRTKQSAMCNASSQTSFNVYYASGAYVEYEKRNHRDAAHANGSNMVTLPLANTGCTIDESTRKSSTVGEHTLVATLNDDAEAWWDGSTERTREFTWTLHKACPIAKQWTEGYVGQAPSYGYNAVGIKGLSRGSLLSPAPTIMSINPTEAAGLVEIAPIGTWGDSSTQYYTVTNKYANDETYQGKAVYALLEFAEGANTAPLTYALYLMQGMQGKPSAGTINSGLSYTYYLSQGVKTHYNGATIYHGEMPALNDVEVYVENEDILTITKNSISKVHSAYQQETEYNISMTVTPKATGKTNIRITIPATEHYRALTFTREITIAS